MTQLGEWDPESRSAVAAYDAVFLDAASAAICWPAFEADLAANAAHGVSDFSETTRAYARDRFGMSDEMLDILALGSITARAARNLLAA